MRALITGADGFVGRHLCEHLRSCGDEVVGVDRNCDVTDLDSVMRIMDESRPRMIYHLAALTHVGESWKQPKEFTRVNVLGTRNVLDAAHKVVPSASILFVSSADVYGIVDDGDLPLVETHRAVPVNPYAQSKREAELLVKAMARGTGQRVLIARPFNHVGPGQSIQFVVPALVNRLLDALENESPEIVVGDLSTRRDFSDVRDVVKAYRLLMKLGRGGEVYNVASGHDVALADIAHDLVDQIAPGVRLVPDASLFRPVEVPVMRGSFDKIHDITGWEPVLPLVVSLRDVIGDLRSRRAEEQASL
jgi:GDP-4-dehydro-6-deoxy-D-mannose reductase